MALTTIDDRGLKTPIDLLDNEKIRFGTGNDLELYHDGSHSYVDNATGNLYIESQNTISIRPKDGENGVKILHDGAVELYYDNSKKLETVSTGVQINGNLNVPTGHVQLNDSQKLRLGNGQDLDIYHDGSYSYIDNTHSGGLWIRGGTSNYQIGIQAKNSENSILCTGDGGVNLYYDNSKKFETRSSGVEVFGDITCDGHYEATDNSEIRLGLHDDLKLYHDGSHSYINHSGTGNFYIYSNGTSDLVLRADPDKESIKCIHDAAVELYYDNSKKLETTSTGVTISGTGTVIGTSSWSYPKALNVQGSTGAILSLANYDTTTYAADTNTSIELRINTGNTGNQNGAVEIRGFKENGTNGNNARGLSFWTAGNGGTNSEKLRIQSGGGISFNGDTAAVNALDDYEEGTWTPSVNGSAGNPSVSYTHQKGYYTKVGNIVHIEWDVLVGSYSGGGGNIQISGLPFNSAAGYYHGSGMQVHGQVADGGNGPRGAYINASSNWFYLVQNDTDTNVVTTDQVNSNFHWMGHMTYRAT